MNSEKNLIKPWTVKKKLELYWATNFQLISYPPPTELWWEMSDCAKLVEDGALFWTFLFGGGGLGGRPGWTGWEGAESGTESDPAFAASPRSRSMLASSGFSMTILKRSSSSFSHSLVNCISLLLSQCSTKLCLTWDLNVWKISRFDNINFILFK